MSRFFFAWVADDAVPFDAEIHAVEDEKVIQFDIEHDEGMIPKLTIVVKNPRVGLLCRSGKQWAWLSAEMTSGVIEPLFLGRLVGIPTSILLEAVTLELLAKPSDYAYQKQALAETLKELPWYDPVFIDPEKRSDPDTVIEARSALWHVDRTTLQVTISDVIIGEDGTESFAENEIIYDSVAITAVEPPLMQVEVTAAVQWKRAGGTPDVAITVGWNGPTYTGGSLIGAWPKSGSSVGGGWVCGSSGAVDVWGIEKAEAETVSVSRSNNEKEHLNGDWMSYSHSETRVPSGANCDGVEERQYGWVDPYSDPPINNPASYSYKADRVILWYVVARASFTPDPKLAYEEHIHFILKVDVQPVVTEPDDASSTEHIDIQGADVGIAIDGAPPIGNVGLASYFTTDRGLQSIQYLIALARAHLLYKARAIKIEWNFGIDRAISLSCRKNATIHDHRLPGGVATGKIISYKISGNGDTGVLIGKVSIGCAIGYGGHVEANAGTPQYAVPGVFAPGVEAYDGQTIVLPDEDVEFPVPVVSAINWGDAVVTMQWHDPMSSLPDEPWFFSKEQAQDYFKENSTWLELELKPASDFLKREFDLGDLTLVLPIQIDLCAGSSP